MKKIAFVMNEMDVGGVSSALIDILNEIDYERYRVTLWVNRGHGEMQGQVNPNVDVKLWGLDSSKKVIWEQIRARDFAGIIRGVWYRILSRLTIKNIDLNSILAVKSLPRASNEVYDCVVCYQGISGVVISNSLYRLSAKKKVIWIHGAHNRAHQAKKYFDQIYNQFDKAFCVSNETRKEFECHFPKTKEKLQVCYNLIDIERIFRLVTENTDMRVAPNSLITVGRLSPEKGQQMIPHTTRLLLDAGYDIHWYLVGDGGLRETVEAEIEKYDVADRVHLLGTQMNPYPYIKNCDIYVQPSFSEGWCLTVQEARILQKPIVVTPLPVMHEQIVDGENGIIAADTTPEALFEGIKTLLDHPELCEKFVDNLRRKVCDNSGELQKLYDFIES